jgi:hypothetical protein
MLPAVHAAGAAFLVQFVRWFQMLPVACHRVWDLLGSIAAPPKARGSLPGRGALDDNHDRRYRGQRRDQDAAFDVLGSIADEARSNAAQITAALAAAGIGGPSLGQRPTRDWARRFDDLTGQIAAGEASWRAELARACKPDSAVYQMTMDLLGLNPREP